MLDMYRIVIVGEIEDGYLVVVLDYFVFFGDIVKYNFREQNGKM